MRFTYSAHGVPGDIAVTVFCDGKTVGTTTGLKNEKAMLAWVGTASAQYKRENTSPAYHAFTVSAHGDFDL